MRSRRESRLRGMWGHEAPAPAEPGLPQQATPAILHPQSSGTRPFPGTRDSPLCFPPPSLCSSQALCLKRGFHPSCPIRLSVLTDGIPGHSIV